MPVIRRLVPIVALGLLVAPSAFAQCNTAPQAVDDFADPARRLGLHDELRDSGVLIEAVRGDRAPALAHGWRGRLGV